MHLQIFDVEHGACALLTCDDGKRIMIDCGDNTTTGWKPGTYLRSIGVKYLEQLIITNYDEDHVSGISNLFDNVSVGWIVRNQSVSTNAIKLLKVKEGIGPGIDRLIWQLDNKFLPAGAPGTVTPTFQGVIAEYFWLTYPYESDDENDLSVVAKFSCKGANIIFPGDIERAGWKSLLGKPGFISSLQHMDIFVASHHGREDGCCDEVFDYCKPRFIVISDKSKGFQSQDTSSYYYERATGGVFRNQQGRRVITTRSDGDVTFVFQGNGYLAY